jgi:hypothetical protein
MSTWSAALTYVAETMGNTQIGQLGSGWLYSAEDKTLVLLSLNDARNIRPQPGEEVIAKVLTAYSPPAQVRIGQPASVLVCADSTITLQVGSASPPAAAAGKIDMVGEVSLSLEYLMRRCGRSVYYTWFPLQQMAGECSQPAESIDQFDRALRSCAREPRSEMVCLSLCPADAPEATAFASGSQYEVNVSATDKCARFPGLMASHTQHARMLQSLYRISRAAQQGRGIDMSTASVDMSSASWAMNASSQSHHVHRGNSWDAGLANRQDSGSSGAFDLPGPQELGGYQQRGAGPTSPPASAAGSKSEEIFKLQKDIENTTEEANKRINQASEAIRTLKDRVAKRAEEHERMRQETERFKQDADALELENERLSLQIERRRRVAPDAREQEVEKLKRDRDTLKEQQEALLAILEDLYGAVGKSDSKEEEAGAAIAAAGPSTATSPFENRANEEGWTNMLPRPSELFASGVLEAA